MTIRTDDHALEEVPLAATANGPAPMSILAVGAVTGLGRDLDRIASILSKPTGLDAPGVDDELLADPAIGRRMRRADRFSRMAAVAAIDAWNGARVGCAGLAPEDIGLIVATGFGPHCRGFRFIDGILDSGDAEALPTDFSHSVHGAAAAYIAEMLSLRGPSLTCTDFEIGFEQAVLLAQCWLAEGRCQRVLVGAAEERGAVLDHCASRMLGNDRIVPGEGAVFLTLGPGTVPGIATLAASNDLADCDLALLDAPPIGPPAAQGPLLSARWAATFSPYFGHSPSSTAFQLLGGLLSLRAGRPLGHALPLVLDEDVLQDRVDVAATIKSSWSLRVTSSVSTAP